MSGSSLSRPLWSRSTYRRILALSSCLYVTLTWESRGVAKCEEQPGYDLLSHLRTRHKLQQSGEHWNNQLRAFAQRWHRWVLRWQLHSLRISYDEIWLRSRRSVFFLSRSSDRVTPTRANHWTLHIVPSFSKASAPLALWINARLWRTTRVTFLKWLLGGVADSNLLDGHATLA